MYRMNISVQDYHREPTYSELMHEAVINPTATINYSNVIATQLRNTSQKTHTSSR
jgi:hypothetical protein